MASKIPSWSPPGHYYSPIVDLEQVRGRHERIFDRKRAELPGVDLDLPRQLDLFHRLAEHYHQWTAYVEGAKRRRFQTANGWFQREDAAFLYFMLNHLRPRHVVEIGSGHSSSLMLDYQEFSAPDLNLTCIDPEPSRLRSTLLAGDESKFTLLHKPVQDVDPSFFGMLKERDILFVDSSHVSKTGSDVNFIFFEVLPRLAPGVHIHIHDIYYPFEYPEEWVYEGWGWNEAYLLRAFLSDNATFRVSIFPSMLQHLVPQAFEQHMPLFCNTFAGSLWMEKIA
jgi:hypothetical protein